eukprot:s1152_g6.t1
MLTKFNAEHVIDNYADLQKALWWCTQAKNACSLKGGFAPEVLVLGKHSRLPGSVSSDMLLPAHMLAEGEHAQGIRFRKQLAYRETARRAFHSADNDAVLRRAMLRRSNPHRGQYQPGEWIMVWKEGSGQNPGFWQGPMKVVVHENQQTLWGTMSSKLFRCAPEHVRPVSAEEARTIVVQPREPAISEIAQQLPADVSGVMTRYVNRSNQNFPDSFPSDTPPVSNTNPHDVPVPPSQSSVSEAQPDDEPELPVEPESNMAPPENLPEKPEEIPIPEEDDDDLVCEGLYCHDVDHNVLEDLDENVGWRSEILVTEADIQDWRQSDHPEDLAFLVSAAKKQRAEVRLTELTASEKAEFVKAKDAEVSNWLQTGTALKEELLSLGFEQSPFCPCTFILRCPKTLKPEGIIGVHVDDGLCGGNERFLSKLAQLEKRYPFGSHKIGQFTFTGIEMFQHPNKSITLSQSEYVKKIEPIHIASSRRPLESEPVTSEERLALRGLIGSLQYASVHTRPDLASRPQAFGEKCEPDLGAFIAANGIPISRTRRWFFQLSDTQVGLPEIWNFFVDWMKANSPDQLFSFALRVYVPEAFLHFQGTGWSSNRCLLHGMCREAAVEIEEEVLEFNLIERLTFLEYLPVKSDIRKSSSSPELTALEFDPHSTSTGPAQKETWGRQVSVSTACSSGATWNRQVSATWSRQESANISCLTFHDTLVNAASTKSDNSDPIPTDFADLAIPETGSSASELGTGQWSVGSALHSMGECKPCAWFWRPGGCTRGESCQHCHLCPRGALQKKKRQNRQMLKALRRSTVASP